VFCVTRLRASSSDAVSDPTWPLAWFNCSFSSSSLDCASVSLACASWSFSRSAPIFASADRSCAWSEFTSFWNGVGSIVNSTSPFLTARLFSTGTSMTRPRTPGTTGTTYLITRTSLVVGAMMLRRSSSAAMATTGKMTTATFQGVVHGSHLNLMKMSQTKNA
jgi:hypothetical protein